MESVILLTCFVVEVVGRLVGVMRDEVWRSAGSEALTVVDCAEDETWVVSTLVDWRRAVAVVDSVLIVLMSGSVLEPESSGTGVGVMFEL